MQTETTNKTQEDQLKQIKSLQEQLNQKELKLVSYTFLEQQHEQLKQEMKKREEQALQTSKSDTKDQANLMQFHNDIIKYKL